MEREEAQKKAKEIAASTNEKKADIYEEVKKKEAEFKEDQKVKA